MKALGLLLFTKVFLIRLKLSLWNRLSDNKRFLSTKMLMNEILYCSGTSDK